MIPNTQSLQHISSHNEFKKMTKTIIQSVAHSTICLTYREILKKTADDPRASATPQNYYS